MAFPERGQIPKESSRQVGFVGGVNTPAEVGGIVSSARPLRESQPGPPIVSTGMSRESSDAPRGRAGSVPTKTSKSTVELWQQEVADIVRRNGVVDAAVVARKYGIQPQAVIAERNRRIQKIALAVVENLDGARSGSERGNFETRVRRAMQGMSEEQLEREYRRLHRVRQLTASAKKTHDDAIASINDELPYASIGSDKTRGERLRRQRDEHKAAKNRLSETPSYRALRLVQSRIAKRQEILLFGE